jgi:hypothetical protein
MGSELRGKEDLRLFFGIKRLIASVQMDIGCLWARGTVCALILIGY